MSQEASQSQPQQGGSTARARFGVHNKQGELAGKTIGQLRSEVGKMWSLTKDTNAMLGTEKLDDDYVIKPGDSIEFTRRQGEKG